MMNAYFTILRAFVMTAAGRSGGGVRERDLARPFCRLQLLEVIESVFFLGALTPIIFMSSSDSEDDDVKSNLENVCNYTFIPSA